jgi:hypothetical protein
MHRLEHSLDEIGNAPACAPGLGNAKSSWLSITDHWQPGPKVRPKVSNFDLSVLSILTRCHPQNGPLS